MIPKNLSLAVTCAAGRFLLLAGLVVDVSSVGAGCLRDDECGIDQILKKVTLHQL